MWRFLVEFWYSRREEGEVVARVMTIEEERKAFGRFRDQLVRRVWELVITCDEHWGQFQHIIPDSTRSLPYRQMAADQGGHARHVIEREFLQLYLAILDCEDGCSAALYEVISELRKLKADLVYRNMGLAYRLAFKYNGSGMKLGLEQTDLVQHALAGLCEGVERFRPEFGHRFSTYGSWWIKHAVTRAIHNGALVRIPVHQHSKGMKAPPIVSLDAKVSDEENAQTFLELLVEDGPSAQEQLTVRDDVMAALEAIERLPRRERKMVRMRFGIAPYTRSHTLREVGSAFGLSRERIRQVVDLRVLPRLRKRLQLAS